MLFARIKRTDPEAGDIIMKNSDTVTLVNGDWVIHDTTAADGVSVKGSGTGGAELIVAGCVVGNDIEVGQYGPVRCFGFHPSAKTSGGGAGAALKTHTVAKTATDGVGGDAPSACLGISITATASGRSKVWIKLM